MSDKRPGDKKGDKPDDDEARRRAAQEKADEDALLGFPAEDPGNWAEHMDTDDTGKTNTANTEDTAETSKKSDTTPSRGRGRGRGGRGGRRTNTDPETDTDRKLMEYKVELYFIHFFPQCSVGHDVCLILILQDTDLDGGTY